LTASGAAPRRVVAVTGASGLFGRSVVAEVSRRHRVIPIDLVAGPDGDTRLVDMLDLPALTDAFAGADAVVHLAALDGARTASEEAFISTNTLGCWNALKAAEQNGIRKMVLCSSISAIGLGPDSPPVCLPVPVDHPKIPISAYGISKQAGEVLAEAFVRRGAMDVICLRPCFIMFPHLVAEVAERVAASDGVPPPIGLVRSAVPMNEELTPTRSFVSPQDAARAFAMALDTDLPGFSAFFVAGADTCSSQPTVELVQAVFGANPPVRDPALFARSPRAGVFDIAPTRAALGWSPEDCWADVVERAVARG
jgi:UDP-glucose 4-epimerase